MLSIRKCYAVQIIRIKANSALFKKNIYIHPSESKKWYLYILFYLIFVYKKIIKLKVNKYLKFAYAEYRFLCF